MNNINEKVKVERYSSILTKTRIDITEQKAIELQKHYLKNRKDKYIPPIFTEFIIVIDITESLRESSLELLKEDMQMYQLYNSADVFAKNNILDNMLNKFESYKKEKKIYNTIFVKYKDSINIELILYDMNCKPVGVLEASYDSLNDDYILNSKSTKEMLDSFNNKDEITQFYYNSFEIFMSVSYYMQHFNSEIEYAEVEVKDNKKSSKNKTNGGYSQKIILKSKKKKYIIKDSDTFSIRKRSEATYYVSSWLTRGHYRRCGKNKVIKYIPPTIHKRKNLNSDKTNKKTYEIK